MSNYSQELLELCGQLRDETISTDDFARLERIIVDDRNAADFYVRFMQVWSGIEQLAVIDLAEATDGQSIDELIGVNRDTDDDFEYESKLSVSRKHRTDRSHRRQTSSRRFTWGAVATTACTLALLVAAVIFRESAENPAPSPSTSIAKLVEAYNPMWEGDQIPELGESVAGDLWLNNGAVKVRFENGAELLVQSPSLFSVVETGHARLTSGTLTMFVPPSAKGFKVDTPWGTIVDRGTRIGIRANTEMGLEAHVFEGRGEVVRDDETSSGMLEAGDAVAVSAEDQTLTRIEAEESYFLRSFETVNDLPVVSGKIQLLMTPPRSVRRVYREIANLRQPIVFAEQRNFATEDMGNVTFTGTGEIERLGSSEVKLALKRRVDSYLVHFTMPMLERRTGDTLIAEGEVRFNRDVLGIVAHEPVRFAKHVAHPVTEYQRDMFTGLEDDVDGDTSKRDQIAISEDRRVVRFRLRITGLDKTKQPDDIDQFRILVESAGQ